MFGINFVSPGNQVDFPKYGEVKFMDYKDGKSLNDFRSMRVLAKKVCNLGVYQMYMNIRWQC